MSERDEKLHLRLMHEDAEYKRLCEKHRSFEERLKELQEKCFLNEDEKIEEKNIKKQKLMLKDKMESIRDRYRKEPA
ncbi:MAG: hypothetical protein AB1756_09435 [Acidobacteriota bacterium]